MTEHLEEMIQELSGKGSKFEWTSEKIEKTEKKFKDFINSRLKRVKKDSIREIRSRLTQLNKSFKDEDKSISEISSDVHGVLEIINSS